MTVLHIEHAIGDYDTWRAAYDRFAERRRAAGVRRERVCRPRDDPHYIYVQLDFDGPHGAEAFLGFLRDRVWSDRAASPGLAGAPTARILDVELDVSSPGGKRADD